MRNGGNALLYIVRRAGIDNVYGQSACCEMHGRAPCFYLHCVCLYLRGLKQGPQGSSATLPGGGCHTLDVCLLVGAAAGVFGLWAMGWFYIFESFSLIAYIVMLQHRCGPQVRLSPAKSSDRLVVARSVGGLRLTHTRSRAYPCSASFVNRRHSNMSRPHRSETTVPPRHQRSVPELDV